MKIIYLILFLLAPFFCISQENMPNEDDFEKIRNVLAVQETAWNTGDLEEFMQGYWKSDLLRFTSSGRTSMGWQNTLDGYVKAYPTLDKMGKLKFEIFDVYGVTADAAALSGTFYLTRKEEDLSGYFTLIFKKMDDEWKIISDTTCAN